MAHGIRFTRIISMADDLAAKLQHLHFASPLAPTTSWQPAMNIYAHADRLDVCLELAGVRKQDIEVTVEPRRLVLRGRRVLPQPASRSDSCCRILLMEIPEGEFERVLDLPAVVDTEKVVARQDDGWLWVSLPMVQPEDNVS